MRNLLILAVILLAGCAEQTRVVESTQTEKQDDITISGTVQMPKAEGGVTPIPITFTIKRTGSETREKQSEANTKPDYTAMGQAMATALQPVMMALAPTGGPSILSLLSGIGGAATVATTGYLALKKREQMKAPAPKHKEAA